MLRLDPRDQAHLDAAAREPAVAAALRRHFEAQHASTFALIGNGPRSATRAAPTHRPLAAVPAELDRVGGDGSVPAQRPGGPVRS
jgi:hypothetical protein